MRRLTTWRTIECSRTAKAAADSYRSPQDFSQCGAIMGEAEEAPKPKLRWYQYRLRTLMIFVVVVCLIMSGVASLWHWYLRARVEFDQAAAPIKELGGWVAGHRPLGAKGVIIVYLCDTPLTDADLETLSGHLETLPDLKELDLDGTRVTDAWLEHLKGLANLRALNLSNTQVSDAGLQHLKGMTNLEALDLDGTQVTNAGLVHLKGLTNLERVELDATQVSDAGLEHLQGLTKLTMLVLGNRVSDAGLEHLKGLTKLEFLWLWDTQVTDEGVEKLQQALPNCEIEY